MALLYDTGRTGLRFYTQSSTADYKGSDQTMTNGITYFNNMYWDNTAATLKNYLYQPINNEVMLRLNDEINVPFQTGIGASKYNLNATNNTITIDIESTSLSWYCTNVIRNNYFPWIIVPADNTAVLSSPLSRMRRQLSPQVHVRGASPLANTPQEVIAQEALREVVTEAEFKKYLRYGFVLVEGRSGATYQVFQNQHHVKVWVGGKLVEEICVYLRAVEGDKAPPTDKVVAFKAMIEADEEAFKSMGNRYRLAVAA